MARKGDRGDLKNIKITDFNYQQGSRRFSETRHPPRLARSRNNLAAFSQYYDLCFVASRDKILVHTPISLEGRLLPPRSTIDVHSYNVGVPGYIDPAYPHSINQLIVADLGLEELVIVATDDGDVVAYMARSIRNEIYDRGRAYNTPCFRSTIKPFFLRSVGHSAWGIAVHQKARMIAVSANSYDIYVFALALGQVDSDSSDEESSHEDAVSEFQPPSDDVQPSPHDRSQTHALILSSHEANIPSIAFCNPYGENTEDVYLASTDIYGITYVWDVWKHRPFLHLTSSRGRTWGWGLLCIDPVFAQQVETTSELFGIEPKIESERGRIDITRALSNAPGYEDTHFSTRQRRKDQGPNEDLMDDSTTDEDESSVEINSDIDAPANEDGFEAFGIPSTEKPKGSAVVNPKLLTLEKVSDPPTQSTFYVFHTMKRDVRLLQFVHRRHPPNLLESEYRVGWQPKEIICEYLLDQHFHRYDRPLKRLQRLNMVHQVPELNLIIAGDQIGRVALLTLTRRKAKKGTDKLDEVGFRVEAFLPSSAQEDAGFRPRMDLLGVAVGPVQGHERQREDLLDAATGIRLKRQRPVRSRAYRVMLYYLDHSVLSYEITR